MADERPGGCPPRPLRQMSSSQACRGPSPAPSARLFGLGSGASGLLGATAAREANPSPLHVPSDPSTSLAWSSVASGPRQTLLLRSDGRVFSAAASSTRLPAPFELSAAEVEGLVGVVAVAVGAEHCLALCEDGSLHAWGSNEAGQLGLSTTHVQKFADTPRKVEGLPDAVVSVAAGSEHSLALCRDGALYAWGRNSLGELGLGTGTPFELRPSRVKALKGVPLAFVAAAGRFSFAVSVSGAVFAWGSNSHGQLATGDKAHRRFPTHVKPLRYLKVVDLACGGAHCLALTRDGRVLSWGRDSEGQLGHGKREDEVQPRLLMELAGTTVLRVAAGRDHSIALLQGSRLSVWGGNAAGQLGLEHLSARLTPALLPPAALQPPAAVFAGHSRSFFLGATAGDAPERPGRDAGGGRIFSLSLASLREELMGKRWEAVGRSVENALSNVACLNASFLADDDAHFGANGTNHGLELDQLMGLTELAETQLGEKERSELSRDIRRAVEWGVLGDLSGSPPDIEALRVYLVLPWLPPFADPDHYRSLQVPLALAFCGLSAVPKKVVRRWWAGLRTRHFARVLRVYRRTVDTILQALKGHLSPGDRAAHLQMAQSCLTLLEALAEVNADEAKVSHDAFYVTDLAEKLNVPEFEDYVRARSGAPFAFAHFPFIYDAPAKALLLQTDARVSQQLHFERANQQNLHSLFNPLLGGAFGGALESPVLHLRVQRQSLVEDAVAGLLSYSDPDSLKKPLKVEFVGEEADDAGGVKKEFFLLLRQELFHPQFGMFYQHPESRLLCFSSPFYQELAFYKLVGVTLGLAIYNGVLFDLHAPLALYKKLLGKEVTLEDLCEVSPTEGRGLRELLDYEGEDVEDVFGLSFQASLHNPVLDTTLTKELKDGGKDLPVTSANKAEFVSLYVEWVLSGSIETQWEAFREGVLRVASAEMLRLFQPLELLELLTGKEEYDWDAFEAAAQYKGDFHRRHPSVQHFWAAFHDLRTDQKRDFLTFLTGCDRVPVTGMGSLAMTVQPSEAGEDHLPVAHTCFNLLDLPRYTSLERATEKLALAIAHPTGFSLV